MMKEDEKDCHSLSLLTYGYKYLVSKTHQSIIIAFHLSEILETNIAK